MSDQITTTIKIGGNISHSNLRILILCLKDDFYNTYDEIHESNIKNLITDDGILSLTGTVNNGNCEETKEFCMINNLSYKIHNEACCDCDAYISFKQPEMEKEYTVQADNNHHPVIRASEIKPYLEECHKYLEAQEFNKALSMLDLVLNTLPQTMDLPPFIITK